jgi:hypothetical protein
MAAIIGKRGEDFDDWQRADERAKESGEGFLIDERFTQSS